MSAEVQATIKASEDRILTRLEQLSPILGPGETKDARVNVEVMEIQAVPAEDQKQTEQETAAHLLDMKLPSVESLKRREMVLGRVKIADPEDLDEEGAISIAHIEDKDLALEKLPLMIPAQAQSQSVFLAGMDGPTPLFSSPVPYSPALTDASQFDSVGSESSGSGSVPRGGGGAAGARLRQHERRIEALEHLLMSVGSALDSAESLRSAGGGPLSKQTSRNSRPDAASEEGEEEGEEEDSPWSGFINQTAARHGRVPAADGSCPVTCDCRCHSVRSYGRWSCTVLAPVVGSLVVSYSGSGLFASSSSSGGTGSNGNSVCDDVACGNNAPGRSPPPTNIRVSYMLPAWLSTLGFSTLYSSRGVAARASTRPAGPSSPRGFGAADDSALTYAAGPELLLRVVRRHAHDPASLRGGVFGAVVRRDLAALRALFASGVASPHDVDHRGVTPLLWAMIDADVSLIRFLLVQAGSDPWHEDDRGRSPVRHAFVSFVSGSRLGRELGDLFPVAEFLDQIGASHVQRIVLGVLRCDLSQALRKRRHVESINHLNAIGLSALHLACIRGSVEHVRALLAAPALDTPAQPAPTAAPVDDDSPPLPPLPFARAVDVNRRSTTSLRTPLHDACYQGRHRIVPLLLAAGADPSARDANGYAAMHHACGGSASTDVRAPMRQRNVVEIVRTLIEAGADARDRDNHGGQPLFNAVVGRCVPAVRFLVRPSRPKMDGTDKGNAAEDAEIGDVEDYHEVDENGESIWGAGAPIGEQDSDGDTPLYDAVTVGSAEVVRLLLEEGGATEAGPSVPIPSQDRPGTMPATGTECSAGSPARDSGVDLGNWGCGTVTRCGWDLLHHLAGSGTVEVLRVFYDWGLEPGDRDEDGERDRKGGCSEPASAEEGREREAVWPARRSRRILRLRKKWRHPLKGLDPTRLDGSGRTARDVFEKRPGVGDELREAFENVLKCVHRLSRETVQSQDGVESGIGSIQDEEFGSEDEAFVDALEQLHAKGSE